MEHPPKQDELNIEFYTNKNRKRKKISFNFAIEHETFCWKVDYFFFIQYLAKKYKKIKMN